MINKLDKGKCVSHRLYRHHTVHLKDSLSGGVYYIKDLGRLGRPLDKTIIIDNTKENFCWHLSNGIHISSFFKRKHDTELLKLTPLLKQIVQQKSHDVRQSLQQIRRTHPHLQMFPLKSECH